MLTRFAQIYKKDPVKALSLISKFYGIRLDLVQAGGGNISIKNEYDNLYIKESGYSFFDVEDLEKGVCKINNYNQVSNDIYSSIPDEMAYLKMNSIGGYPSLETFMHCLTKKITVHLHPIAVIDCLGSKDKRELLFKNFNSGFINYVKPGKNLAIKLKDTFSNKLPNVVFLENHGMIVNGDTPEEVFPVIDEVVKYAAQISNYNFSLYEKCSEIQQLFYSTFADKSIPYVIPTKYIVNRETPDCLVYCGDDIPIITGKNTLLRAKRIPSIISYCGHLYIVGKNYLKCKQIEDVAYMHSLLKNVPSLSEEMINEILDWNSEKLRNGR